MRLRGFFGFGLMLRRVMLGAPFDFARMGWRIEVDFLVWHWRINLFRDEP